jgi:hypothetical protein
VDAEAIDPKLEAMGMAGKGNIDIPEFAADDRVPETGIMG